MHVTHRKRFVSRDLVALAARRPQELAALSEAHYHDQIESIADEVLAAGQRIVMLTGPSAAGKTTSAHKIADAIAARGHRSQVISLDDFYIGEGKYPKHPDGSDDYESLEALDLERLHACLKALYKTGICDAPVFDFTIQRPSGTQRIDSRDGVVIIEGLHALNPALTEELPEDAALCLYAGGIRRQPRRALPGHAGHPPGTPSGAGLPVPRPRRSVHAGAVGPRLRGLGPLYQALQAPRQSPAGHDPYLRGLPVAYRAGRHAGRPGADRHPSAPIGRPAGKICGVPGAWHRAGAPKQHAAGVYRQIILHNSRKIYICALQTAPQWAIIDLNRTAELPRQG